MKWVALSATFSYAYYFYGWWGIAALVLMLVAWQAAIIFLAKRYLANGVGFIDALQLWIERLRRG